jgi:hypothetical protein
MGVHNFVSVCFTDCEWCCVGFEGGEAVTEVGCGAMEGSAVEVTHRVDGKAECPAYLVLEDVEVVIAKEAEMEGEVFPIRSPRMTPILRDCVSGEENRALMRDVRFSSRQCLVKVRVVLSSIPRTR